VEAAKDRGALSQIEAGEGWDVGLAR